jgi:hypothetical protein
MRCQVLTYLFVEKVRVGPGANEDDLAGFAAIINSIGKQEIAADVAFAMSLPRPFERVVKPLRSKRGLVGYQQQHGFFEPVHIESARA